MKPYVSYFIAFLMVISLTSCEVIAGIFKGGMWTGAILVIAVFGLIIWVVAKMFGGGRS